MHRHLSAKPGGDIRIRRDQHIRLQLKYHGNRDSQRKR